MTQYYILSMELFNIKKGILNLLINDNKQTSPVYLAAITETGKQLRIDLDALKFELFAGATLSDFDKREVRKSNERIMVKLSAFKKRFEKSLLPIMPLFMAIPKRISIK
jgi:hypothetical protein